MEQSHTIKAEAAAYLPGLQDQSENLTFILEAPDSGEGKAIGTPPMDCSIFLWKLE